MLFDFTFKKGHNCVSFIIIIIAVTPITFLFQVERVTVYIFISVFSLALFGPSFSYIALFSVLNFLGGLYPCNIYN